MSGTRRKPGAMGPFVEGFRGRLLELGYAPGTVRGVLKDMGQLGRWMDATDVRAGDLSRTAVESFIGSRRAAGVGRVASVRSFAALLDYLGDEGVLTTGAVVVVTPVESLLAEYRTWMIVERGLAGSTVLRYENLARRFLEERVVAAGDRFVADITAAAVTAFLLKEAGRVSVGAAKGRVAELRSLLRFLYLRGWTDVALATTIPPVAGWHDAGLPVGIAALDVERLLAGCDRHTTSGVRDRAILTLVARLGLRSAEVARLELGDIDWRAGEIVVRGKGRRIDRLPLPFDVGDALSAYLSLPRRPTSTRQVFLAMKAPTRAIPPALVSDVCHRACRRSGVAVVGAHRLRHALATEMLRQGAALVEVSQVLRHRDLATTAIYAKVDLSSLRAVAQPWPGGRA
jgi:site-specific recombinase XerD